MTDYLASNFDKESPEVVSAIDDAPIWSAPFGLRLLDTIRYVNGISVLDIGSGSGFPLLELSMRLGNKSTFCGIDPWDAAVKRTAHKIAVYGITNVSIVEGRAEHLPFKDGSFDLVTSNNGINNVANLDAALDDISRVARPGAQFVFTFNTDRTFIEFYQAIRETLYKLGMPECNKQLTEHIFEKRKPVGFMELRLREAGFRISAIRDDMFRYRFSNGTAMLNHFFMRLAFLESWKEIVPRARRKEFFQALEESLNLVSERTGELCMQVPFVIFDCERR